MEGEACVSGACIGATATTSQPLFAEATVGLGTTITGSVAAMPEASFAEHHFQYGLFGYIATVPEQLTPFMVANYYVVD